MTIKEMEQLAGMERANIRFYEQEGFITPSRMENGYRNYCVEELELLLRIKLLRKLDVSLEDMKALNAGNQKLSEILSKQIERLEANRQEELCAREICKMMQNDNVNFQDLLAAEYLKKIETREQESSKFSFGIQEETDLQAFQPWKRYLARTFDLFFYNIMLTTVISIVFHVSILTQNSWFRLCFYAFTLLVMLFLEPLLLHKFGTTPGKFILGIRLESVDGRMLSYNEALDRTWDVLLVGMGFHIPIWGWIALAQSYKHCIEEEKQQWDEETVYTIKEINWARILGMAGAYVAVAAILMIASFAQGLPPNRGELTIEQFAENYNYYVRLYKNEPGKFIYGYEMKLKEDGTWDVLAEPGSISYESFAQYPPLLTFETKNDRITSIMAKVSIEEKQTHISSYKEFMTFSSMAFIGAQKQTTLFSDFITQIGEKMAASSFNEFHINKSNIRIDNEVETKGYVNTIDCLTPYEESSAFSYQQNFTIQKYHTVW